MRGACLATLIMLVVQYGVGIFLNLYVPVPASDAHAGMIQEIDTAPIALTGHALLGLALIGTAILLLFKAARARDRIITVLAGAGLGAIGGAFAAGEAFVKNGQSGTSFAMAALTGVALLCYVCVLAALPARRRGLPVSVGTAATFSAGTVSAGTVPVVTVSAATGVTAPAAAAYRQAARPLPRRPMAGPPLTAHVHRGAAWSPEPQMAPWAPPRAPRAPQRRGNRIPEAPGAPTSWFGPQ
jgi:hypothetical protein